MSPCHLMTRLTDISALRNAITHKKESKTTVPQAAGKYKLDFLFCPADTEADNAVPAHRELQTL